MSERQSAPSVRTFAREDPDPADPAFVAKLQQASTWPTRDRAMALAHKLSAELREAQSRINQLEIEADGLVAEVRVETEAAVAKLQADANARVERTKREADERVARLQAEAKARVARAQIARAGQAARRP